MQSVILSIGDELALGQTVDTNAAWLSAKLAERGIPTPSLFCEQLARDIESKPSSRLPARRASPHEQANCSAPELSSCNSSVTSVG